MGFLADTETAVTTNFTTVANAFGSGILDVFRPTFIVGFTIWITLIGYEVAFGKSEDGFTYLFTKIGKMFLIGVMALYGWPEVSELLAGVKDGFVGNNTMSSTLENNLMTPVSALWAGLFDWFTATLGDVGWTELGRLLSTLSLFALLFLGYGVMTLAVSVFGVVAMAMFLVANAVFVLLMAVGPVFLLCLAFPFVQRFFETYIGNVVTSILAMAFTVLMVAFVAQLFGLVGIQTIVPVATDAATVATEVRSMVVLFASKGALALLVIYLYYKVFDLAAALGGGLNVGNNLVGGVRAMLRDAQRSSAARGAAGNAVAQGRRGGGSSRGSAGASAQRAGRANGTLTGMALGAIGPAISATARGALSVGGAAGTGVGNIGRFAYNRYSQLTNRTSAG